ncbi:MAG: DNA polymerase III subunit beta [Bacteroidaceae bacterium]
MKFTVSSTALSNRLQAIGRVITQKNNLPILECFLFEINDNKLLVTASDSETTLSATIDLVESSENFRFAIRAKTIQDVMKEIPEQPLTFDVNPNNLSIIAIYQNGKYSVVGLDAKEYPTGTSIDHEAMEMTITSNVLLEGINHAMFAIGDDGMRPVMNGIFFEFTPEGLTMVATDSRKMVCEKNSSIKSLENMSFVLPKKPALMLKNLLEKNDTSISIHFNKSNAQITSSDFSMTNRLIEGRYPNYKAVIPKENPNCFTIDRATILSALKRILVFSNQGTSLVKIRLNKNLLILSTQDIDFSTSAEEAIVCEYNGMPMSIGFNGNYLIEMLSNIPGENITMQLADPSKAGIIVPSIQEENMDILMLLMPSMLND